MNMYEEIRDVVQAISSCKDRSILDNLPHTELPHKEYVPGVSLKYVWGLVGHPHITVCLDLTRNGQHIDVQGLTDPDKAALLWLLVPPNRERPIRCFDWEPYYGCGPVIEGNGMPLYRSYIDIPGEGCFHRWYHKPSYAPIEEDRHKIHIGFAVAFQWKDIP